MDYHCISGYWSSQSNRIGSAFTFFIGSDRLSSDRQHPMQIESCSSSARLLLLARIGVTISDRIVVTHSDRVGVPPSSQFVLSPLVGSGRVQLPRWSARELLKWIGSCSSLRIVAPHQIWIGSWRGFAIGGEHADRCLRIGSWHMSTIGSGREVRSDPTCNFLQSFQRAVYAIRRRF